MQDLQSALQSAISQFLVSKSSAGLRPKTLEWYEHMLGSFTRWLPSNADPGNPETIEQFLDHLRQRGLAPATVKGHYTGLCVFFAWCVERKKLGLSGSPTALLKPPRVPKRRQRVASVEEYKTLVDSIPRDTWVNLRDRLLVQSLFLGGVRIGALVRAEVDAYNVAVNMITVAEAKGGNDRSVPMLPVVKSAYIEYMFHRPAGTGWLFLAANGIQQPTGKHITANGARQRLKKLCSKAGIRYLNPHAFRHGLAVHLLNSKGADMSLIQQVLGHKQLSTTANIYAIWDEAGVYAQYQEIMSED